MAVDPDPGQVPPELLERLNRLAPTFSWQDLWAEEHRVAFTVAKAMETDILASMRDAVKDALVNGMTWREFQKDKRLRRVLADKGWWGRKQARDPITGESKDVQLGSPHRLRVIAHTNLRTARAAGQWQRITQRRGSMPYLRYRLGASAEHRPEHEELDGMILPVDHPFWSQGMPPNGYGCNCWVEQLTERRARSLGISTSAPGSVRSTNPRTGKVVSAPRGVAPEFAYNPGANRFAGL